MRTLTLSGATLKLIETHRAPGHTFKSNAIPRGDGLFDVPFSEDVHERVEQSRFPGEDDDAVIVRLIEFYSHGGSN